MRRRDWLGWLAVLLIGLGVAWPVSADSSYIVQPSDTLSQIAERFGITTGALAQANGLSNVNHIYVGQVLIIPDGSTPTPATGGSYVVQPGDTLAKIAARYGLTWVTLAQANSLGNANHIYVGQVLIIPGEAQPQPAPAPAPEAPTGGSYTVQAGDTLARIAWRYGLSWTALAQANGLTNPNHIYAGQVLTIPGAGSAPVIVAPGDPATRWIDVNLSTQTLIAYEGDTPVLYTAISSGVAAHPTVTGVFSVWLRNESQAMSGPGYYLPNVPYVMYFYRDYALHGTYWHNNFGTPMSHGCVNLTIADAQWLYYWSDYGTTVNVHY